MKHTYVHHFKSGARVVATVAPGEPLRETWLGEPGTDAASLREWRAWRLLLLMDCSQGHEGSAHVARWFPPTDF